MKIILKTNNKKSAMALLFGIKGLSTENNLITIDELNKMDNPNIFISLDKNMFNSDLEFLEETLKELEGKTLGILFYDLSVLSIVKRLNLNINLIWKGDFLTTNYKTCEYYYNEGVSGVVLSNVLTKDEICEISNNTSLDTFVNIFGYQEMALSKRHLISNYFEYINEDNNSNIHNMIERGKEYKTKEEDYGTKMYSDYILNGIKYLNDLKESGVKYIILDSFNIDDKVFDKIVNIYEKALMGNNNLNKLNDEIDKLIGTETGFFDKKTIYKVKRK